MAAVLHCPKCRSPLPDAFLGAADFLPCPICRSEVKCAVFPAFSAPPRIGRPGEPLVDAEEASCFFHASKRASITCDACGRFLCALCDLELAEQHLCPSCFSAGRRKGALRELDHYRVMWPNLALAIVIAPLLVFSFMVPFTAIAALGVALIGLRKPGSVTGRSQRLAYILAIALALAELGGSVVFGKQLLESFTAVHGEETQ
ncbi:MAG TPA: hypothetical protein VF593_02225 [Chthoniobacteraceae bacterium]